RQVLLHRPLLRLRPRGARAGRRAARGRPVLRRDQDRAPARWRALGRGGRQHHGAPSGRVAVRRELSVERREDYVATAIFSFANGFTTSRAQSMKSWVTGLSVRFFKVMIPTGHGGMGTFTGRTLSGGRFAPNRSIEPGKNPRKGPLASSAQNS